MTGARRRAVTLGSRELRRLVPRVPHRRLRSLTRWQRAAAIRERARNAGYWRPRTLGECEQIGGTCTSCWRGFPDLRPGDRCPDCGAELVFRCPFVGCKAHLYLDVHDVTGALKLNFPDLEPLELPHPCVFRAIGEARAIEAELNASAPHRHLEDHPFADLIHMEQSIVAKLLNVTRGRVNQIERRALSKLRDVAAATGLYSSEGLAAAGRAVDARETYDLAPADALRQDGEEIERAWDAAWDRAAGLAAELEAHEGDAADDLVARLRRLLASGGGAPRRLADLAGELTAPPAVVGRALAWLQRRGEAARVRGAWRLELDDDAAEATAERRAA